MRVCDWIEDRYGNKTYLKYKDPADVVEGVEQPQLEQVIIGDDDPDDNSTDPAGKRWLEFTWEDLASDPLHPAYRITDVTAYAYGGVVLQKVHYDYYETACSDAGGELYNLRAVTVYGDHDSPVTTARTTEFTYLDPTLVDPTSKSPNNCGGEKGLLRTIKLPDPTDTEEGATITYEYKLHGMWPYDAPTPDLPYTQTVWVSSINEPAGEDYPDGITYEIANDPQGGVAFPNASVRSFVFVPGAVDEFQGVGVASDAKLRAVFVNTGLGQADNRHQVWYDGSNNVIAKQEILRAISRDQGLCDGQPAVRQDNYHYGRHGNVKYHWIEGFSDVNGGLTNLETASGVDKIKYYGEEYYFQKKFAIDQSGRTTTFKYGSRYLDGEDLGKRGNLMKVWDAAHYPGSNPDSPTNEVAFTYDYNMYGQKIEEINLNGVKTWYYYDDAWGNLTEVVQDPGETGNPNPLHRVTDMTYDAAGRVTNRVDPNLNESVVVYNDLGQPITADMGDETISYGYQDNGRLQTVQVINNSTLNETYSSSVGYQTGCDRVASTTETVPGVSPMTISYTYTKLGSIATRVLPDNTFFSYKYGVKGGVSTIYVGALQDGDPNSYHEILNSMKYHASVTDPGRTVIEYQNWDSVGGERFGHEYKRDASGEYERDETTGELKTLVSSFTTRPVLEESTQSGCNCDSNGLNCDSCDYFTNGRAAKVATLFRPETDDPVELACNEYGWTGYPGYDAVGNRLRNRVTQVVTDGSMQQYTESYTYDALNRLTGVDYGGGITQGYAFDDMGNRLTKTESGGMGNQTCVYDHANRLISLNSVTQNYFHDANGNTTVGGGRTNAWDAQNRLIQCVANSKTSAYTYGPDGLRRTMSVTTGSGTGATTTKTHFLIDGQNVAQERQDLDHDGIIRADEVTATYIIGPRGTEAKMTGNPEDPTFRWYVTDGLGSVIAEVGTPDASGNPVKSTRRYDVYGAVRSSTGAGNKQQFCGSLGHTADDDTGLIYMRARYYDRAIGRFVSEDSAEDGLNWYTYCAGNPVNRNDPSGHLTASDQVQVAGAAGGIMSRGSAISAIRDCILNRIADLQAQSITAQLEGLGARVTPANASQLSRSLSGVGQRVLNVSVRGFQSACVRIDARAGHVNIGFPKGIGDPHVGFDAIDDVGQLVMDVLKYEGVLF